MRHQRIRRMTATLKAKLLAAKLGYIATCREYAFKARSAHEAGETLAATTAWRTYDYYKGLVDDIDFELAGR